MGVCGRILTRGSQVTIRWVPAHQGIRGGVQGNEKADKFAKTAANRSAQCNDEDVPDEFRWEKPHYDGR